jgi:hypothetical protein
MPHLNNIPEVLYDANQPYHYHYDNLPLRNILQRIDLVNIQVDTNTDILRGSGGSAGSLSERLEVSLEESGRLKKSAVDFCEHSIGAHADTNEFVRMTIEERARLASMDNSANKLYLDVAGSVFSSGTLVFEDSDTAYFDSPSSNRIRVNVDFPLDTAHRHYYEVDPFLDIGSSSSSMNYKTTITGKPFAEGSLRVYVNGVRLSSSSMMPVAVWDGSSWRNTYVASQNPVAGTFSLNRVLGGTEFIFIDFDESFD